MEAIEIATGHELRTTPENQLLAHPSEMLGVWGECARRPLVNTQATRLKSDNGAPRIPEFMGSVALPLRPGGDQREVSQARSNFGMNRSRGKKCLFAWSGDANRARKPGRDEAPGQTNRGPVSASLDALPCGPFAWYECFPRMSSAPCAARIGVSSSFLESQPRHFLEIAPIGREQQGVACQRNRRDFQITRGNSNQGRLK